MKITLFTSNKNRHNYLINLLSKFCDELFVIQECGTIFPGVVPGHYPASNTMKNYFKEVSNAETKLFGNSYIKSLSKKIKILPILSGDLNQCSLSFLSDFLKSDIYIVLLGSDIAKVISKKLFLQIENNNILDGPGFNVFSLDGEGYT